MRRHLQSLLVAERRRQTGRLLLAAASAAVVAAASVLLLGLSGWFITGAAVAGLAGAAGASAFNVLLPSACIRLLAILRTGGRYAERLSGHDAAFRALARIRPALFRGLAGLPSQEALDFASGDAVARIVQDVNEMEAHFVRRSAPWAAWAACVSGAVLLVFTSWTAMASAVGIIIATLLVALGLSRMSEARGRAIPTAAGRLKEDFSALISAAPELRAYGLEIWAAEQVSQQAIRLVAAQERVTASGGWFELLLATATGLASMLVLGLAHATPLPIAALAVLGAAMSVDGVGGCIKGLQRQGALREAERRLDDMLGPDEPLPQSLIAASECPVLEVTSLPLRLAPGIIAGLIGPSGCGKTTLIEQILGLRLVADGQIMLDGVDINHGEPHASRRYFAQLPQDACLLTGTVRDNLLLAFPGSTDLQMWEALHDAALDTRVRVLPKGLDTWLGENGSRLSGGEQRRLALARAYLRPAPLLLLDEPTEGLDPQTEQAVIERLHGRLTRQRQGALIVSHRTAPIALCNIVVRMDLQSSISARKTVTP